MDDLCQRISRCINIDSKREKYTKAYDRVRKAVIDGLRENKHFKELFCDLKLCGSYADNLKISDPDEFDLVIQLTFPYSDLVKIHPDPINTGNVFINLSGVLKELEKRKNEIMHQFLKERVNKEGFLLEDKFQAWLQGLVTKYLTTIDKRLDFGGQILDLKYKKQGPAHTIYVSRDTFKFSIDFVPGFKFDTSLSTSKRKPPPGYWEAIPRPIKDKRSIPCDIQNNPSFRTSYTKCERDMFVKMEQFKNTLRFMKKFRDKAELTNLKSYFIKTVFLWQLVEVDASFWRKPSTEIIYAMFEKLENALKDKKIGFFWNEKLNLLGNLKDSQIENMHNQVKSARKKILSGREEFLSVFLTKEQQREEEQSEEKQREMDEEKKEVLNARLSKQSPDYGKDFKTLRSEVANIKSKVENVESVLLMQIKDNNMPVTSIEERHNRDNDTILANQSESLIELEKQQNTTSTQIKQIFKILEDLVIRIGAIEFKSEETLKENEKLQRQIEELQSQKNQKDEQQKMTI